MTSRLFALIALSMVYLSQAQYHTHTEDRPLWNRQIKLYHAIHAGDKTAIDEALQKGADINNNYVFEHRETNILEEAIRSASQTGNFEIIKKVITFPGFDRESHNYLIIIHAHSAAYANNATQSKEFEILEMLLACGLNPNEQDDEDGDTALHTMAQFPQGTNREHVFKIIDMLLEYGADPNTRNKNRQTVYNCIPGQRMAPVRQRIQNGRAAYLKEKAAAQAQLVAELSACVHLASNFSGPLSKIIAEYAVDEAEIFACMQERTKKTAAQESQQSGNAEKRRRIE